MKLLSIGSILIVVILGKEPSCTKSGAPSGRLLPLEKGNEWIYRDSVVEHGKLVSVSLDTLRIEQTATFEGVTSFIFSDGKEMMLRGDTLFQLVHQRGGYKFATPFFIPSSGENTYNFAFGGDVMIQRTVNQIQNCPPMVWSISNCYQISDGCRGEMLFGSGIGIIRERITECSAPVGNYTSRTLVSINFKP